MWSCVGGNGREGVERYKRVAGEEDVGVGWWVMWITSES